jgi:hypothetical protein
MGDIFTTFTQPELKIKLHGTAPFARVSIIKNGSYAYVTDSGSELVYFTWRDTAAVRGTQSYYYVRGEQQDGEIVWASPMWITYK